MVIVERKGRKRWAEKVIRKQERKRGISTSNMTTTQGAGLGVRGKGEERRQRRRRGREEGASCGCYVHFGLYLFDPLLFKHRKREKKEIER